MKICHEHFAAVFFSFLFMWIMFSWLITIILPSDAALKPSFPPLGKLKAPFSHHVDPNSTPKIPWFICFLNKYEIISCHQSLGTVSSLSHQNIRFKNTSGEAPRHRCHGDGVVIRACGDRNEGWTEWSRCGNVIKPAFLWDTWRQPGCFNDVRLYVS